MKKLLSGGLAAVIGACIIAPFSVSADTTTKQWSASEWDSLFSVVTGQYLGSDLQYHSCEFRSVGASSLIQENIYPGYQSFVGRTVVYYQAYVDSQSNIPIQAYYNSAALYDSKFIMDFDFSFVDCNYCSIGFMSYCYPDSEYQAFLGTNLTIFEETNTNCWAYENNYIRTTPYTNNYTAPCQIREANHNRFLCTGGLAPISQSPGTIHFKQLDFALVGSNDSSGSFIAIVLPITNVDAQIVLGGDDSGDSTNVSGSLDGSITPDGSSGYDVNVNVNVNIPDYHNDINPSYDSSGMDEMKDMVDSVADAENSLLSSADNDLSSLPGDLEWDDDLVEEAVGNPFETFFNENIIGIMVFWVGSIAFISYILFGKWV